MEMYIPENAAIIIERLMAHGFEAYAVGGCVRDSILGREPEDWDLSLIHIYRIIPDVFGRHTICNVYFDTESYELIRASIKKPPYLSLIHI